MTHRVKVTIECTKSDDPEWGTTTTHEVRNLSYEKLVTFQRDLFDGLGSIIFKYSEDKITKEAGAQERYTTPAPNAFVR